MWGVLLQLTRAAPRPSFTVWPPQSVSANVSGPARSVQHKPRDKGHHRSEPLAGAIGPGVCSAQCELFRLRDASVVGQGLCGPEMASLSPVP